jgi:hypothetical protein
VDDDHLAVSFVGLHHAMRLAYLIEAERARRLRLEAAGRLLLE